MKSSNVAFASAIAMIAAVVTTPAQATTTCGILSAADAPQQATACAGAQKTVIVESQTWSSFFNAGTGASLAKAVEFPTPGAALVLTSYVLCIDGTQRSITGSSNGTEVDQLAGCDRGTLAVLGEGFAVMNN